MKKVLYFLLYVFQGKERTKERKKNNFPIVLTYKFSLSF